MRDVIFFSHPSLFNDKSSIVADESAENKESSIKIKIEEELGSKKDVDEGEEKKDRETREESSSQIQSPSMIREEG